MKENFPGYYKDEDLVDVLKRKNVLIVLDSSVLCNLYGFHDETWKSIIDFLDKKRDALWLPYNMALAYHQGIVHTLENKINLLVSLKKRLLQTTNMLNDLPFSFTEYQLYKTQSDTISSRLTREIAMMKQRGKKDSEIREKIAQLYKGKIGISNSDPDPQSFKVTTYKNITETDALSDKNNHVEGVNEQKISKEMDNNDVILHTLIKLSKDKSKDVLYVISEPSDYWSIFIGKTSYGPNPEHQSYFYKSTFGNNFYCCPFASFMQNLAISVGETLSGEIKSSLKWLSYGAVAQNDSTI